MPLTIGLKTVEAKKVERQKPPKCPQMNIVEDIVEYCEKSKHVECKAEEITRRRAKAAWNTRKGHVPPIIWNVIDLVQSNEPRVTNDVEC